MKRCYGSTALAVTLSAGLAVWAGGAAAQTPPNFKVTIGGDAYFEAGFIDQKRDTGLRSTEFRNRMRLVIIPSAKADNGLEYGGRLRIRANNADRTTDADRAFVFAQGGFGTLRAGVMNGYDDDVHLFMQSPVDWRMLTIYNEPFAYLSSTTANGVATNADLPFNKAGFDWNDYNLIENNATKFLYSTPRIAGFQFGVDFTPRNDSSNTDVNRVKLGSGSATATTTFQNMLEAGLNYSDTLGGVGVKAFISSMTGSAVNTPTVSYRDLRVWHAGGQLSYGVWSAGVGYMDVGTSGLSKAPGIVADRTRAVNAGLQYNDNRIAAGFHYQHGQDAGNPALPGKRTVDAYMIGALYTIAPGLLAGGEYTLFRSRSDTAGRDDRGSVVLLHTALIF